MDELRKLINSVTSQLYLNAIIRCILLAVSCYLIVSVFSGFVSVQSILASVAGLFFGFYQTGIFRIKKSTAVSLIHEHVGETEYSLHLLEKNDLNLAEQLQLERLNFDADSVQFPFAKLYAGIWIYAGILLFSIGLYLIYPMISLDSAIKETDHKFITDAKSANSLTPPDLQTAHVSVSPPAYTQLPKTTSDDLNVSALAGSMIQWNVRFSHDQNLMVKLANSNGAEVAFKNSNGSFTYSDKITGSGLYTIRGYWKDSLVYQSDFYKLEALPDLAPKIEPASKELYKYHLLKDKKSFQIAAKISDDFRVNQAFIVATVARGSGENVKFREVKFPLSPSNFKEANLQKTIDLNALNFAPGDELYYYWAAVDNKQPEANFTKSDTYFLVYKDTAQIEEAELATMAVNIMPEYFRSQRQIIIDTEKLIAKRKKLGKQEFNSGSNEIGFDQKVLRLRYGQYLGEEFETSIGGAGGPPAEESGQSGNIVDAFTHKSDGEGEAAERRASEPAHHDDHDHDHGNSDSKDPLAALMEQYVHAHDDGEANTFYEESTRSLLKMALEQMWQSELHLRMYEPEKALPFENKALEFLKSAQHKARTFVKKSGYDPPPIKENEKRLTGEMKDLNENLKGEKVFAQTSTELLVAKVIGYLDIQNPSKSQLTNLQLAGSALSDRMIKSGPINGGLQNWKVIGSLQKLASGKRLNDNELKELKSELYKKSGHSEQAKEGYLSEKKLEEAFWKKLR